MTERYRGTERDYETFMTTSLIPVMNLLIAKVGVVCLYLNELMYARIARDVRACTRVVRFKTNHRKECLIYVWKNENKVNIPN